LSAVEDKWAGEQAGEAYAQRRFRSARAAQRDPRLVRGLLARHGLPAGARVLDAPCGSGRLSAALRESAQALALVRLDAQRPMLLSAMEHGGPASSVQGSLAALPFAARSFDAVVCCRLLHHLRARADLERVVGELVRVSRELIVASFWDAASLPALRVRLGFKRDEGPGGRGHISRPDIGALFERAGAPVVEFRGVLRFVTQQTFLVARRSAAP
jgi:SAM-dependent methyltransferase